MPSKSVSAVKRVSQTLQAYRRHYSTRALLDRSYDALAMSMRLSEKRSWPEREECFAAIKLAQQNREWSNYRRFGTNSTKFHLANRMGVTPRRNSIVALRNSYAKRGTTAESQRTAAQPYSDSYSEKENLSDESDEDVEVGTVREVVFGKMDKEDDNLLQREADAELLTRVTRHRPSYRQALSKKVIAPYSTYNTHRDTWAAFRHRMIYGGTGY